MEQKLNLGELIIHQVEFDLDRKQKYETKAIGIIAIVAFVIGIVTSYIGVVFDVDIGESGFICYLSACCWCRRLFIIACLTSCCVTYIIGVIILLICVNTIKGRNVNFINQEKLFNVYQSSKHNAEDVDDEIIKNCVEINKVNVQCNNKLEQNIICLSALLFWFMICFMISAITVFFLKLL